jgi:hypothetical protein
MCWPYYRHPATLGNCPVGRMQVRSGDPAIPEGSREPCRTACTMTSSGRSFVENQIGVGRGCHAADRRIVRRRSDPWVFQQQVGDCLDPRLYPDCSLGRPICDVSQNLFEISERWDRVAEPHSPYLAQTARTWSSVANSPRAAAALERAMAARSSAVSGTGSSLTASPASASIVRAMPSCSSAGSCRTASRACSSRLVIARDKAVQGRS